MAKKPLFMFQRTDTNGMVRESYLGRRLFKVKKIRIRFTYPEEAEEILNGLKKKEAQDYVVSIRTLYMFCGIPLEGDLEGLFSYFGWTKTDLEKCRIKKRRFPDPDYEMIFSRPRMFRKSLDGYSLHKDE